MLKNTKYNFFRDEQKVAKGGGVGSEKIEVVE